MYDNYNYPPGADTPDAPWNQVDPEEKEFDVAVCQVLSKDTTITSTHYDVEKDDECPDVITTDNIKWKWEYSRQHYTPLELIELFKEYLQKDLVRFGDTIDKGRYKYLIEECSNWEEDDTDVINN